MPNKKKIAVLTGAGISAESGLATFRDSGGLWEGFSIDEVASISGWQANPKAVLDFYNLRRAQAALAEPNEAHKALASLEDHFEVSIITQNVDDLHERAGSTSVVHLHGELRKACSEHDKSLNYNIGNSPIHLGDLADDGSQLRPAIVWFGEMVPMIEIATEIISDAEIFLVVGTSLVVYPAAGLLEYAFNASFKALIDPLTPEHINYKGWKVVKKTASEGLPEIKRTLLEKVQ